MVKGFPCDYLPDVVCPHKKCACVMNPSVCMALNCLHFDKWMRGMDDEDMRVMEEIELLREIGGDEFRRLQREKREADFTVEEIDLIRKVGCDEFVRRLREKRRKESSR